jgi:hypothetical protein
MTHQCRMCGAITFDNRPHGPIRCKDCGSYGAGTIDTFDEDRDDNDQEHADDREGGDQA